MISSTPAAAAAAVTLWATATENGISRALHGKPEAQPPRTRNQPVLAVLRLRHIAAVHQRLEDAVDAGLGDVGLLVDIFKRQRGVVCSSNSITSSALERIGIRYSRLIFALGNRSSPLSGVSLNRNAANKNSLFQA